MNAGTGSYLQVLLPGEVPDPGSPSGKTAANPTAVKSTTSFAVTVRTVDIRWNRIADQNVAIQFNTNGNEQFGIGLASQIFTNAQGEAILSNVQLRTVSPGAERTLIIASFTAVGDMGFYYSSATASPATRGVQVNVSSPTRIQFPLPGETHLPGSVPGKTGTVNVSTAGASFRVAIWSTDIHWNRTPPINTTVIRLSTSPVTGDPYAVMPGDQQMVGGTTDFTVTYLRATRNRSVGNATMMYSSHVLVASVASGDALVSTVSAGMRVNPLPVSKLQVLMDGETADPGFGPYDTGNTGGRVGTPTSANAGGIATATVRTVDMYWNLNISSAVTLDSDTSDPNDTEPAGTLQILPLVTGSTVYHFSPVTAGTHTVNIRDTSEVVSPSTSAVFTVNGRPRPVSRFFARRNFEQR